MEKVAGSSPVGSTTYYDPGGDPNATLDPEESKVRGIRRFTRPDGPRPFCVQWQVDGQVKSEYFKDAKDRDKRARGDGLFPSVRIVKQSPIPARTSNFCRWSSKE